jgi:hypothetical protein
MMQNNIRIFHPEVRLVTPDLVSKVKAFGWLIFPYVGLAKETDPEAIWSYLMTLQVDGLCTNYPRQLKLWLKEAKDDSRRFESIRNLGM